MAEFKTILVPIDFSEHSKNALRYSVDFATVFGARLVLVYVVEPVIYPSDLGFGQVTIPSLEEDMQSRGKQEIQRLAEQEIPQSIEYETHIRSGKPFIEINRLACECGADLVIIATHGHSGIEQVLFGSTAEKVVRKAPCAVLTLKVQT
jgi:nucleotide-binding universal stress UspA family protein